MKARELLKTRETYDKEYPTISLSDAEEAMIEFAQMHVEEALKQATIKIVKDALETYGSEVPDCWDLDSILYAYPPINIK